MKYLIFILFVMVSTLLQAQKLELINSDSVSNLPLGQGIELELRLKIDEFSLDKSKYELIAQPRLTSKFILIPRETGLHKIGPFKSGNLVSNDLLPLTGVS
jgi:hypothetical protein